MKILFKIQNFDKKKSYHKVVPQPTVKSVPVYPDPKMCPCHYGYNCDERIDYSKPLYYKEVPIERT